MARSSRVSARGLGVRREPGTVSSARPGGGAANRLLPKPVDVVVPGVARPFAPDSDPAVIAAREAAEARKQTELAQVAADRQRLNSDFGLGEDGRVDLANPYSKLALLRKSFERGKRSTETSMGARGQRFSGAYERAQKMNQEDFTQGDASLRQAWQDARAGLSARVAGAGAARDSAGADALADYTDRLSRLDALVAPRVGAPPHLGPKPTSAPRPSPTARTSRPRRSGGLRIRRGTTTIRGGLNGL